MGPSVRAERVTGVRDAEEGVCHCCGCWDLWAKGPWLQGSVEETVLTARKQLGKRGAKVRWDPSAFARLPGTHYCSLPEKRGARRGHALGCSGLHGPWRSGGE